MSLLAAVAAVGLLLAVGLAVDGGTKIRAARQADGYAAEAGRAAGQAIIAADAIHNGRLTLDPAAAARAAQAYLARVGVTGSVYRTGPATLTVETTIARPTVFLSLLGIDEISVRGRATVRLVRGVTGDPGGN